jgi:cytochrome c oxidase subunit 2
MMVRTYLMVAAITLLISPYAFAQGHDHHGHKGSMPGHVGSETSSAIEASNKVCPVSGQKVGEMGPAVKVEHNGKIYNLCCSGCVEMFKADPDKYIKIIKEETSGENGHEGHHHMIGEMNQHIKAETPGERFIKTKERIPSSGQVKEFNFEAYQYGYSPKQLVVKKGDIVKLHATSQDVPHGVFIKEYGVNVPVKKGAVEEIEFVADKAGEFDILCSVYCGSGHNSMKAKLIAEE